MFTDRRLAARRLVRHLAEPIEPRRLLAASLNGGVLQITGDGSSETYAVTLDGSELAVSRNGTTGQRFEKASVTRIDAKLGNGDDSITIDFAIDTPASLNGEAGDDTLVGGSGHDTLNGGSGTDSMNGGGGDASSDGTSVTDQDNTLAYTGRTDALTITLTITEQFIEPDALRAGLFSSGSGGATGENDTFANVQTIVGGLGNDTITLNGGSNGPTNTGSGAARIDGGAGDDTFAVNSGYTSSVPNVSVVVNGDAGNDRLDYGGNGNGFELLPLTLNGGDGDDTFARSADDSGYSSLDGGEGTDWLSIENEIPAAYTIPTNVENFRGRNVTGVTGNSLDNLIDVQNASFDVTVNGGNGDDTIQGSQWGSSLYGGPGNDVIRGGAGDDTLTGGSGNDQLDPGTGNDSVDGGDGGDAMTYEGRGVGVNGALVASLVDLGNGSVAVRRDATVTLTDAGVAEADSGVDIEVLTGGDLGDTLDATFTPDDWSSDAVREQLVFAPFILNGVGGDDRLTLRGVDDPALYNSDLGFVANGGDGADSIASSELAAAQVAMDGGAGDDAMSYDGNLGLTLVAGGGHDVLTLHARFTDFTSGDRYVMPDDLEDLSVQAVRLEVDGNALANRIACTDGPLSVYALGGDDTIYGSAVNDTLYGGDGRDRIWGRGGDDRIDGGNSNDVLRGEDGDDKVYGRDGNDDLDGGDGRDSLYGGNGNDLLNGGGGRDINYGEAGDDTGYKQSIDRIFKQIELLA